MLSLVRVDDRLLHGQVLGAWVPDTGADHLVVVSDKAAGDSFESAVMASCSCGDLKVEVCGVSAAVEQFLAGAYEEGKIILIVSDLADARKLYDGGVRFNSLNIGNIHHGELNGRTLTRSVVVNEDDESFIESFIADGIEIDIRGLPGSEATEYTKDN